MSDILFALLFADDSNLFLFGQKPDVLIETMNTEMVKIIEWLKINKLSLNLKKTHFMIFRRRRGRILLNKKLNVDSVDIEMTDKTKFLGGSLTNT